MVQRQKPRRLTLWLRQMLSIVLIVGGTGGAMVFLTWQSLEVTPSDNGVLVDFRTWGFYSPNIRRITVAETITSNVVWDVEAPYRPLPVRTVSLVPGPNPVMPGGSTNGTVVVPASGDLFVLESGVRYTISVKSTLSRNNCQASTEFTMP